MSSWPLPASSPDELTVCLSRIAITRRDCTGSFRVVSALHRLLEMPNRPYRCVVITTLVLLFGTPIRANAQRAFVGAGVGVASLPRSLEPLCGSARRLTGPTLSAQAGLYAKQLRLSAGLDVTARGYSEAADCIAKVGTAVDSIFAADNNTAMTAAGNVWFLATRELNVGVGAGWVPGHESWFTSGGVGMQYRRIRAEITARWHRTSFDEVVREFTGQGVREISRSSHTESSWGGSIRLLLVTR